MTKGELVDSVSTNTGLSKKQTRKALDVTLDAIGGALSRGEEVNFRELPGVRKVPGCRARPAKWCQPPHPRADHDPRQTGAEVLGRRWLEIEGHGPDLSPLADSGRFAAALREAPRTSRLLAHSWRPTGNARRCVICSGRFRWATRPRAVEPGGRGQVRAA